MSEASRRAAEIVHEISEIDMPISVDKCESYMCEHWAEKAAVVIDTAIARAVEGERERCAQVARNSVDRERPAMATSALATMRATADRIAVALRAPAQVDTRKMDDADYSIHMGQVGVTCGCGQTPVHSTIDRDFHPRGEKA